MPTENRSSNTEMVSFPRELSDDLAELIAAKARVCGGGAYEIWEAICKGFGQPAKQHQGEPVMRLECEKLWGGDGEYAVDFVKPGWLQECREKGGTFLLYTNPAPADPGEVERLRNQLKIMTRFRNEFEGKAERLEGENETLRAELVDAIRSLKTISDLAGRDEFMQDMADVRGYARSRSSAANYILSASAEPSAPKCRKCGDPCTHDDDGHDECRFCTAGVPSNPNGASAPVEIDERASFEYHHRVCDLVRDEDCPEDYRNQSVQDSWEGWQARAALGRKTS